MADKDIAEKSLEAILKLLGALNNDPNFEQVLLVPERRPMTMCDAVERLIEEGKKLGQAEAAEIIAQLKAENAELRARLEEKNKE